MSDGTEDLSSKNLGAVNEETVDLYDNDQLVTSVVVTEGRWQYSMAGLSEGAHLLTAKIRGVASPSRQFSVAPLWIDPSPMTFTSIAIVVNWPRTGNDAYTLTRTPRGGKPPYTYSSANTQIATVTSAGTVQGMHNGRTTVTVVDSAQNRVSYPVVVTNVWTLEASNGSFPNAAQAWDWIKSRGTTPSSDHELDTLVRLLMHLYVRPFPGGSINKWLYVVGNWHFAWSPRLDNYANFSPDASGWSAWSIIRTRESKSIS